MKASLAVITLLKQHCNPVLVDKLPVSSLVQYSGQGRIHRKERGVHAVPREDTSPVRACVPNLQSFFDKRRAVEVCAPVIKDPERRPKAVDQIPTPLPA